MNAFSPFFKSLCNLFVSCCLHYVMNLISFCLLKFKLSCLQYQVMRKEIIASNVFLKSFDLLAVYIYVLFLRLFCLSRFCKIVIITLDVGN